METEKTQFMTYIVMLDRSGSNTAPLGRRELVELDRSVSQRFVKDVLKRMDGGDLESHGRDVAAPRSGVAPFVYIRADEEGAALLEGDPRVVAVSGCWGNAMMLQLIR